jgi:catechol 2,3-dioxygenase-like lactoylglutathione lyase family enzyme
MNEREKPIKAIGEIALRVKNMKVMLDFYEKILGLEIMKDFGEIVFFKVAPGYAGHIQVFVLFDESMPPDHRSRHLIDLDAQTTSLHHFAFTIDQTDYATEKERLERLGLEVETMEHEWIHWRSLFILDPESNLVELVCYDASVGGQ